MHTTTERHIRCNPSLAQFIIAPGFQPVLAANPFDKAHLDPQFVREREALVTRGWLRLAEIARTADLPIVEYPLPEFRQPPDA